MSETNDVERLVSCHKCSKQWGDDDFIETQECLYKHDVGGFGSVFGDGQRWKVVLCQECAFSLLEPYIEWISDS